MAVIETEGLFKGKRLRKCSTAARWHWPYLFLLSNGYARIELDYECIADEFSSFRESAPTPDELRETFAEFRTNHLLYVYKVNDQEWGQWDTRRSLLKEYKTAADKGSPAPPDLEYRQWLIEQHGNEWAEFHWNKDLALGTSDTDSPKTLPNVDQALPKVFKQIEEVPCGVGVGVGRGVGRGKDNPPSFPNKNPEPEELFEGSEWALKTCKAYPRWKDPDALAVSPVLGDLYMQVIQREAPARGGEPQAAEWLLARMVQFAKQHKEAGTDEQFIPSLKNFLADGLYAQVAMPVVHQQKPVESEEEMQARAIREAAERRAEREERRRRRNGE